MNTPQSHVIYLLDSLMIEITNRESLNLVCMSQKIIFSVKTCENAKHFPSED